MLNTVLATLIPLFIAGLWYMLNVPEDFYERGEDFKPSKVFLVLVWGPISLCVLVSVGSLLIGLHNWFVG